MNYLFGRRPLTASIYKIQEVSHHVFRQRPRSWRSPASQTRQKHVFAKKPLYHSFMDSGAGYIAGRDIGIVTVDGVPASRRILLIARDRFKVVRDVWSQPDGTYLFARLNEQKEYIVMALDHEAKYEPVVYDFVRPAVMRGGDDGGGDGG